MNDIDFMEFWLDLSIRSLSVSLIQIMGKLLQEGIVAGARKIGTKLA